LSFTFVIYFEFVFSKYVLRNKFRKKIDIVYMAVFSKFLTLAATLFLFNVKVGSNSFCKRNLFMKKDFTNQFKSVQSFYKPKTFNQEIYTSYLNDSRVKILFAIGPAGTGKTMLACNNAIKELKNGAVSKIVLTRPVVPVEEDIGFLPGNINKKMDPWTKPIFDIFLDFYSQKEIDLMVQNNIIEIAPLAYMRGRTFKKSFIIADEMQNSSPNQMLMLTTRIGEGSKMVLTGDLHQSDKGQLSGLSDLIQKIKLHEKFIKKKIEIFRFLNHTIAGDLEKLLETGIKIVELNTTDIERSPVITKLLDIYSFNEEKYNKEIDSLQKKEIEVNSNTIDNKTIVEINIKDHSDCALIPISHISKNYINNVDSKKNK